MKGSPDSQGGQGIEMLRDRVWSGPRNGTELGKCLQVGGSGRAGFLEKGFPPLQMNQPSAKGWAGRVRGQNSIRRRKSNRNNSGPKGGPLADRGVEGNEEIKTEKEQMERRERLESALSTEVTWILVATEKFWE